MNAGILNASTIFKLSPSVYVLLVFQFVTAIKKVILQIFKIMKHNNLKILYNF